MSQVNTPFPESPGDTWIKVDVALRNGLRGLPGGSTLHRFLVKHGRGNVSWQARARGRGAPVRWLVRAPLHRDQILGWADAHFCGQGRWPSSASGAIPEADRLTWKAVDLALRKGLRGLPEGSSLHKLLVRNGRGYVAWRPQHDAQGRFLPQS